MGKLLRAVLLLILVFAPQAAFASKRIRIGVSLGITGQLKEPAAMQERAYKQWRDEVNSRGGLLGHPIELIIRDDEGSTEKALAIYRDFVANDGADIVFGPYSSEITAAIAKTVDAAGYPMLAAGASADEIWRQGYHNIFGMWTPASRYTQGILRQAHEAGLTSIAILYASDSFSTEIAAGTRKWGPYLKLKIVLDEGYAKNSSDLADEIRRAQTSGAELVVIAGHLNEAIQAKLALRQIGWVPRAFFATVGPALPVWSTLVADPADVTFATSIWEPNDSFPHSRDFAAAFEKRYGVAASYHAATAYAAGEILEAAINAAGTTERGKVREALINLDTYTVLGRFAVDSTGIQVKRLDMLIQWQNGQKEIVWPEEIRTRPPVFGPGTP
jgi:branched-chain amino acid transport system substrate-binding protein